MHLSANAATLPVSCAALATAGRIARNGTQAPWEDRMLKRLVRNLKLRMLLLAALTAALVGWLSMAALPASAAPAHPANASSATVTAIPDTGNGCGSGFDFDSTCTTVYGTGLHVDSVQISFTQSVLDPHWWTAHIEILGPKGKIKNCASFTSNPGYNDNHVIGCTWSPNHSEPSGNYCGITWGENSPTNYRDLDEACVDVHS